MRRIAAILAAASLGGCARGVLDPQGPVAAGERTILFNSVAIMLMVIVPTIIATIAFAIWYRVGNARAERKPDFVYSGQLEAIIWSIPALIVLFLGGIAWVSSHELDPAAPLTGGPPIEVQVVSLDWKWLFIYPGQNVATVNRLIVPAGVPINFRLTSATVLNSFFVPQLGSQIYTMAGMTTQLNLKADRPGRYFGLSTHFSGDGFSGMHFDVRALPPAQFTAWAAGIRRAPPLDVRHYAALARESSDVVPHAYGAVQPGLFDAIVRQTAPPALPAPEKRSQAAISPVAGS